MSCAPGQGGLRHRSPLGRTADRLDRTRPRFRLRIQAVPQGGCFPECKEKAAAGKGTERAWAAAIIAEGSKEHQGAARRRGPLPALPRPCPASPSMSHRVPATIGPPGRLMGLTHAVPGTPRRPWIFDTFFPPDLSFFPPPISIFFPDAARGTAGPCAKPGGSPEGPPTRPSRPFLGGRWSLGASLHSARPRGPRHRPARVQVEALASATLRRACCSGSCSSPR